MSEVRLEADLEINATGLKSGADKGVSSLQALQAEMVRTQKVLSGETDTGNIDRLQRKIVGLGNAIQVISKGKIQANDIIPSNVANSVQAQTNAINSATQTVGANVKGLSYNMNRAMHGVPELFYAPGRAINILATQIPNVIDRFRTLSAEQKSLAAAGKPALSSTQLLTAAFDPLNLAIGLGVLALVKYVPKLIEMALASDKATDSVTVMTDALKDDKGYSGAIANVNKLTEDIYLARTGFLDKQKVVKEYNETIGKTTGIVNNLDEAESALIKNKDAYLNMMAQKAVAAYAYQKAAEATVESQIKLLDSKKFSVGDFFKGALSGNQGGMGYINSVTNGIADATQKAKDFNKIASDAEANAASIAKAFNFNLFGDDKVDKAGKDKKVKHIKDVVDVLAEMNKSFADTDAQVEAHTLHIGDVAKKNLGGVTKTINELIKMGVKPSDPIIQGLDTLHNALEIKTSNKDVVNIQPPKVKLLAPEIDKKKLAADWIASIGDPLRSSLVDVSSAIQNIAKEGALGLAQGIGDAIGSGDFSNFGSDFLGSLGQAIENFGKQVVEQALLVKGLQESLLATINTGNWGAAVGIGLALVAAGAALAAIARKGGGDSNKASSSSFSRNSGSSGYSSYATPSSYSGAYASSSGGASVSNASSNIASNLAASLGAIQIQGETIIENDAIKIAYQRADKAGSR